MTKCPNSPFESPYLGPIQNGKLVIMFSNLSGTGRFSWEIQACSCSSLRHYITSVNAKNKSQLVHYIACEDAAGGRSYPLERIMC